MNSFPGESERTMSEKGSWREPGQTNCAPHLHLQGADPMFNDLRALIVSPDDAIRRKVAEVLTSRGIAPLIAFSVAGGQIALSRHKVCMVLCDESVEDGGYRALIDIAKRANPFLPVIVISQKGDWPEYLTATSAGAFDYLAYPPVPGELPRVISQALIASGFPHQEPLMEGHSPSHAGEPL
jgi:DNA-binding NtrC family response regulator